MVEGGWHSSTKQDGTTSFAVKTRVILLKRVQLALAAAVASIHALVGDLQFDYTIDTLSEGGSSMLCYAEAVVV